MKVCPLIFAALCITPAFAAEFEIVRGSESPDQSVALAVRISDADKNHPEIVFFDVQQRSPIGANLSEKHIFRLIALAQKDSVHCPHYEVAWSSNGRRVAVYAGSHQFTGVDAYELRDGGPIALRLPDLTPQWREIDGWITPFRRTKRWKTSPAWNDQNQLLFSLGGSAYKNDGARESDFLSFAFRVTVRFDEAGEGRVEDTSKEA